MHLFHCSLPSMVLSSFFKFFTKRTANRKSEISGRKDKHAKYPAADLPEGIQRQFSLAEIKAATNNFHENLVIGEGGFGIGYRGFFNHGNLVIAVKRLKPDESREGLNVFQTDAIFLSQLQHPHLVSLLGICCEDDEMILVYEYMSNGSLDNHLHYRSEKDPLPWKKRLQICIDTARGLHYLHTGAKQTIIHRDIKSSNIILDDNWDSKICNFGLSKLRPRNKSKALRRIDSVKGTFGYLDPEYFRRSILTEKSDVYSFGIVLFEVLCARKALDAELPGDHVSLAECARNCREGGTIYNIIDPYLMGKIDPECFKIFVDAAFCCINDEGNRRPDMGEVELMLELALQMQEKAESGMYGASFSSSW